MVVGVDVGFVRGVRKIAVQQTVEESDLDRRRKEIRY